MTNDERDELRASLLRGLRPKVPLSPEDRDEAFVRHILLAIRIHRAAKLSQTVTGDGKGWIQFVTDYFPVGRNSEHDAKLLRDDWRVGLVKDETPYGGIALCHGEPELHWDKDKDMHHRLIIDLESMYADFEHAVDQFITALEAHPDHAAVVLQRWRERTWSVQSLELVPQMPIQVGSRFTGLIPGAKSVTATETTLKS